MTLDTAETSTPASFARSTAAASDGMLRTERPALLDVLNGELFKIARQRTTWLMGLVLAGLIVGTYGLSLTIPNLKQDIYLGELHVMYRLMTTSLLVLRVFSGTLLILLTARLIGMEYSGGTIRVLLSRGVGRLQLLGAKLAAVGLVALGILVAGFLLNCLLTCLFLLVVEGNLDALSSLDSQFWADTWLYLVTIVISMAASILMAAAVTIVARSLVFGLAAGISFFAVDNIGLIFFRLAYLVTHSDFWLNVTAIFLGPNLNAMPGALLPADAGIQQVRALPEPWVPVDAAHALVVTLAWTLAFAATAVLLTWRRDVTE
jgi:ABC-2 type transport system permease protein